MSTDREAAEIDKQLKEYFDPRELKWKPQSVKGNRALALVYIDARCVMDRLDDVLGIAGWQTSYLQVGPDSFECRLSIRVGGEWIVRADVGNTSDQPDAGDKVKAAYSDGLKRAAVQFGVGRYLYRMPQQWVDYDPQKRQFAAQPRVPDWAIPARFKAAASQAEKVGGLLSMMAQRMKVEPSKVIDKVLADYHVDSLADLTAAQSAEVMQRANAKIAELAKAPTTPAA